MISSNRRVVIALGGNAIQQPGQRGTFEEQLFSIDVAAGHIAQLVAEGHKVVVTHGNGPQVGYPFQQCLENRLGRLGQELMVATTVTETEVDDPAFAASSSAT